MASSGSSETVPRSLPTGAFCMSTAETAAWPKTSRRQSPVPRLGSISPLSSSSSGDWHQAETTYAALSQWISERTFCHNDNLLSATGLKKCLPVNCSRP
jgi:hypothetical protein